MIKYKIPMLKRWQTLNVFGGFGGDQGSKHKTFGIGAKLTQIAFLVLLSTTVVVCWVSAMELDKVHRGRESEKNMQPVGKKTRNSNSDNKTLVVIGASYTRGWNISEIAGLKVVNKGVNGNQSSEMLARFQADVIAVKPRAVIIWGFINDIFGSKRDEVNDTLEKVKEHYKKICNSDTGEGWNGAERGRETPGAG